MTGTELRHALWALGLSQKEFAATVGIRAESISRYIRGHVPVPQAVKEAIESLKDKDAAQ